MDHHLLLVRDDAEAYRQLTHELREHGYTVVSASKHELAANPELADGFDVVVLDFPNSQTRISAIDMCSHLRRRNLETTLVVLAERNRAEDRVAFFKAGVDDYLVRPLDFEELECRIEALLIRSVRNKKQEISCYEFAGRRVDFLKSELIRNRSKIGLSEREVRLLRYFIQNRGKTLSRSALLQHVWGYTRAPLTRTVDVHILRLRHKIEDNPKEPRFIVTVPGFGYRFDG
jgi:two-component system, OmpR family, alkaline phosphatase synthesis response regulator PhoP